MTTNWNSLAAELLYAATREDLSLSAKGALLHLFALQHSDQKITMQRLLLETRSGRTALNSALRELEEAGCVTRTRQREGAGMLAGYQWELFPISSFPF